MLQFNLRFAHRVCGTWRHKRWGPYDRPWPRRCQHDLGNLYAQGEGVLKDVSQAVVWFRKAAEQGLAAAQYELSLLYAEGEGVPLDLIQAHAWSNLATMGGSEDAGRYVTALQERMTRTQRRRTETQPRAG